MRMWASNLVYVKLCRFQYKKQDLLTFILKAFCEWEPKPAVSSLTLDGKFASGPQMAPLFIHKKENHHIRVHHSVSVHLLSLRKYRRVTTFLKDLICFSSWNYRLQRWTSIWTSLLQKKDAPLKGQYGFIPQQKQVLLWLSSSGKPKFSVEHSRLSYEFWSEPVFHPRFSVTVLVTITFSMQNLL